MNEQDKELLKMIEEFEQSLDYRFAVFEQSLQDSNDEFEEQYVLDCYFNGHATEDDVLAVMDNANKPF